MKLTILKTEVILQILFSLGNFVFCADTILKFDIDSTIFVSLFYIGAANIFGFIIRIFLIKSIFNQIYFFGLVCFLVFTIIISLVNIDVAVFFILIFGLIFHFFYLISGFYLIADLKKSPKPLKS